MYEQVLRAGASLLVSAEGISRPGQVVISLIKYSRLGMSRHRLAEDSSEASRPDISLKTGSQYKR